MAKLSDSIAIESYCNNHKRILSFAAKLSESQLTFQATPRALSLAFHLWHLGRWADHLQAAIPGMTVELSQHLPPGRQVWKKVKGAENWQHFTGALGYAETGMEMDETAASQLKFPPKEILLDYVRQAFTAADTVVQAIDASQLQMEEQPQPITEGVWSPGGTVESAIMEHLIHDSRHLGMMECLLGLQTGAGSASV